jgi:hypothetical protein
MQLGSGMASSSGKLALEKCALERHKLQKHKLTEMAYGKSGGTGFDFMLNALHIVVRALLLLKVRLEDLLLLQQHLGLLALTELHGVASISFEPERTDGKNESSKNQEKEKNIA